MNWLKEDENRILILAALAAALVFAVLYARSLVPIEEPEAPPAANALADWDVSQSAMNGAPLEEDKSIYEDNANIYDVYISAFPTKDASGNMLDLSAFGLHTARDHDYNPVLNCNIQILPEGEKPDPLLDLDSKNATIQVRGNSARGDTYKSYRVKLSDEAGTFFGQKVLNINKHSEDIPKISSKLCTDLLADIPDIAGYRTYFMRLWIRDASLPEDEQEFEYNGLYTEIEQPNKTYLEAHGLSSNAVMYKARDFSFIPREEIRDVDDPLYSEHEFEQVLGIREGDNHSKLLDMIDAVNDTTRDFQEIFSTYFNEENYLTWMAFSMLAGIRDLENHNYILYSPENSLTWYFLPWDFDGAQWIDNMYNTLPSLNGPQRLNIVSLHRRYFHMEGSMEKLERKMQELLDTVVTRERVTELVDSYKPVLEKTMSLQPDIDRLLFTPDELVPYLDGIYDGILTNYKNFQTAIQSPAPGFVAEPERQANGWIKFAWEPFYSYQGRTVTYNIQVYSDLEMQNLLYEDTGLTSTEYVMEQPLENGTYYVMISAVDSEGNTQVSLERIEEIGDIWIIVPGLREFTLG